MVFCTWLLSMTSLRFIHAVACISISFLFIVKNYSIIWIDHILFFHSPVKGHLDCFHIGYPLDSNAEFDPKTTITNPIPCGATCWNQNKGQLQSSSFPPHPGKGRNTGINWSYNCLTILSPHMVTAWETGSSFLQMYLKSSATTFLNCSLSISSH